MGGDILQAKTLNYIKKEQRLCLLYYWHVTHLHLLNEPTLYTKRRIMGVYRRQLENVLISDFSPIFEGKEGHLYP